MDVDFIKKLNDLAKNLRQHDMNMTSNEAINKASKMLRNNDSFNEMKENNASSFNETVAKRFNISQKVETDEENIRNLNARIANDKANLNDFFSKVDYELKKLEPKKNIINYLLFTDLKKINPILNKKQSAKLEVKRELESSLPKVANMQQNQIKQPTTPKQQPTVAQPQNVNAQNKSNSVDLFNFFSGGSSSTPASKPQPTIARPQTQPQNNTKPKGKVDLFDFFNSK